MGQVHVRFEQGIAVVTVDNPPMNVMSTDIGQQISETMDSLERDPEVFGVIFTGAGDRAFMAGADIKGFPRYIENGTGEQMALDLDATLQKVHRLGKPTLAALNGYTLGGGCELALACDFRFAEDHVQIGLPEVKLGVFPGAGGTQRLPRLVGESVAKMLILTGEPVSAEEAFRIGLVNKVVDKGQVLSAALEFMSVFRARSQATIRLAKASIDEGLGLSLDEGLRQEARYFGEVFKTDDAKEGIQAFIEKRSPVFRHR